MQHLKIIRGIIVLLIFTTSNTIAQKPGARWLQQMAYDEVNQQVLMFGGAGNDKLFKDLWSFKNGAWKKLADNGPSGVIKSAFAFDAERKCAVLFGGAGDGNKPLDETWEWDGEHWKKINIPGPPARIHAMAAYDSKNKVVVLFGGFGSDGQLTDTWFYNGKSWTQMNAHGPSNCLPHGIFFDDKKGSIILITLSATTDANASKVKNEMWEWSRNAWVNIPNGSVSTATGNLQTIAPYANGEVVLLDGDDVTGKKAKTWVFANNKWTGILFSSPSPRIGAGMVYDKLKHRTLLFGGGNRKDVFNDLWEWDGKGWNEVK
jgi:hypothetical protein